MLTQLERKILDYITDYVVKNGQAPTLREIGESLDIKSKGTVHRYVESLKNKKYLRRQGKGWRDIQLTAKNRQSLTILPMKGQFTSGRTIENLPDDKEVNFSELLLGPDRFVLKVKGNSMIDAGILNGDLIVVKKTQTVKNGDIVLALIDNEEATLKRLKKHGDMIELVADNPSTTSMIYPSNRVHIQGVVTGQVRLYKSAMVPD
ncbi:MAG: repressor LexA [Gammaproteobacteria bacterium]|nr:repressor LexA [Gammaproteobacteria bacterium]